MKNKQQAIESLHMMSFDRIYTIDEMHEMETIWKTEKSLHALRKAEAKYSAIGTARRKEHRL